MGTLLAVETIPGRLQATPIGPMALLSYTGIITDLFYYYVPGTTVHTVHCFCF